MGAAYLFYLGLNLIRQPQHGINTSVHYQTNTTTLFQSFKEGFLCNLLNPKVMAFFFSLFPLIMPHILSPIEKLGYALEILIITLVWFVSLALLITLPRFKTLLDQIQQWISYGLGSLLIGFSVFSLFLLFK